MDKLEKSWRRYHYKNLTYFTIGIIIGLILIKTPLFREFVLHMGNYGLIGAFIGGILFVSTNSD